MRLQLSLVWANSLVFGQVNYLEIIFLFCRFSFNLSRLMNIEEENISQKSRKNLDGMD